MHNLKRQVTPLRVQFKTTAMKKDSDTIMVTITKPTRKTLHLFYFCIQAFAKSICYMMGCIGNDIGKMCFN